jgi:hexosaminidase
MLKQLLPALLCITVAQAQEIDIIPKPVEMKMGAGKFILDKNTCILAYAEGQIAVANVFNQFLKNYYAFTLPIKNKTANTDHLITFSSIHLESNFPEEGYQLNIRKNRIEIAAKTQAGLFYGIQTLLQLLPVQKQNFPFSIPQLSITDYPRFPYRGMHLDVSRHFFPVSYIRKYIDYLAFHKMNYFHWHLTDDQGWRMEIKKYPKLTTIGAWREGTIIGRYPGTGNDSIHYGGYYTQEQIKEIIQYAADRYITVIPEIDMPGHDMAALAAYPQLGTRPDSIYKVAQTWGIFGKMNNVLAPSDFTFQFIQDVLDEVIHLFPSQYIHIGGDEVYKKWWQDCNFCQQFMKANGLKDEHELQSYFIKRIEKYVNSKGRTIIGWDEILEGGLAPNAIVMSWRGEKGGIEAARQNHYVIMTPDKPLYFNRSQTEKEDSLTHGGLNTVEDVYNYEPIPKELNEQQAKYILGAQGNVWTEYISNERKVEYTIFPRMSALSEVTWSKKDQKKLPDFKKRMKTQFKRYDLWKVNYSTAHFEN